MTVIGDKYRIIDRNCQHIARCLKYLESDDKELAGFAADYIKKLSKCNAIHREEIEYLLKLQMVADAANGRAVA